MVFKINDIQIRPVKDGMLLAHKFICGNECALIINQSPEGTACFVFCARPTIHIRWAVILNGVPRIGTE